MKERAERERAVAVRWRIERLYEFVMEHFVAQSSGVSVKDIAAGLGWSESLVRQLLLNLSLQIDRPRACPRDCRGDNFEAGTVCVNLYRPSSYQLASEIRRLKAIIEREGR